MNVLIFGSAGQVGSKVAELFPGATGFDHNSGSKTFLDITMKKRVTEVIREVSPDVVINCAAMTSVDKCETHRREAYEVNSKGVKHIVDATREIGAHLVHLSTDYVFDGVRGDYSEDDIPCPVNFYGLSKLIGDAFAVSYESALIVRTSGVFGSGHNFPLYAIDRLKRKEPVEALAGFYSPVHATLLAKCIEWMVRNRTKGIINIGGDAISRFEFSAGIAKRFNFEISLIREVSSIPTFTATRPFNSSLNIENAKGMINFDFHSMSANLDALAKEMKGN